MNAPIACHSSGDKAQRIMRPRVLGSLVEQTCVFHVQHCTNAIVKHKSMDQFAFFPRFILVDFVFSAIQSLWFAFLQ